LADRQKTPEQVDRFVRQVAEKQGWALSPDKPFLEHIKQGLMTTHNREGYFLCPCRDGSGLREEDEDIVCPCIYNVPDQKEYGHCFCGLFFDPEYLKNGGEFKQIPDRRPEELYD
jgi:ferredoxin-thioredoxin reductase catalytic chain